MFNGKQRYALLSIVAACVTIGLKFGAYLLTGSIGLFSDAAESVVNLIAAIMALWMLTIAMRPPDHDHAFGHSKAEYFASPSGMSYYSLIFCRPTSSYFIIISSITLYSYSY